MKTSLVVPVLALVLGCTSNSSPKEEAKAPSYEIQLHTVSGDLRPGGNGKGFWLQVVQQPANQVVDFRNWPTGTWQWELLGVPAGGDGGHFATPASGHFSDLVFPPDFPATNTTLSQVYYPPAALPAGTIRLELKIRITITPPDSLQGGPVARADFPQVIDVNAAALAPPLTEGQ